MRREITLLNNYLKSESDDATKELLKNAIELYKQGQQPSLPIRIEASLLLGSNELLSDDTDFSSDEFKAKIKFAREQLKYLPIEEHIYSFYSEKKQAQDAKWVDSYSTKLKAAGVIDLESKIVAMTKSFLDGATLDEVLADVDESQKIYFEKLVKVAIRTQWAEDCIREGISAINEGRKPEYPEYPL